MTVLEALSLGVVQGITEFLPVSSSGHLAIAQRLIPGFRQPGVTFDVALHLGTVAAAVALEWVRIRDAWSRGAIGRLIAQVGLASAATAVVALPLRVRAEAAFARPYAVAAGFAVTGLLLLMGRGARVGAGPAETPWWTVAYVGFAQGVAVMPGVSRSGSTIAAGSAAGMERLWAVDFSFLVSIPAVLGAACVEGWSHRVDLARDASVLAGPALLGGLVAAAVGGASLVAVRRLVQAGRLQLFAWYLLPLALLVALSAATGRL